MGLSPTKTQDTKTKHSQNIPAADPQSKLSGEHA